MVIILYSLSGRKFTLTFSFSLNYFFFLN